MKVPHETKLITASCIDEGRSEMTLIEYSISYSLSYYLIINVFLNFFSENPPTRVLTFVLIKVVLNNFMNA